MNRFSLRRAVAVLTVAGACAALFGQAVRPAQKWRVQYFYDQDKSVLNIVDLQFPSATRGLAVGAIVEGRNQKPVAVVTSDGGAHWQTVNLEDPPLSLYFLNESLGWLVTTKGLYQTTEAGRNWFRDQYAYDFKVGEDGAFSIPEVLPGKYSLYLHVAQGSLGSGLDSKASNPGDHVIAQVGAKVAVTDAVGDNASAVDLGDIILIATP